MKSFSLPTPRGERKIGPGEPCFIIAEMSGNHHQNFDKAVAIIKAAAEAGADAIKLQTYTPDTMTIDCDRPEFVVGGKDHPDLWKGQKLYDLYKTAYTPWEWQTDLKRIAEENGLFFFSTPFDPTAVDFLETLGVSCYKIASYEATDFTLLRRVAQTGKPVIISVGFATKDEARFSLETLRKYGAKDIIVLYCVTAYAGEPSLDEMNLNTMRDIVREFDVLVGFSDNNGGIEVPALAAAMGAVAIEKHVMIDRNEGGPDARFSLNQDEFAAMVVAIRRQERIMGKVQYGCQGKAEKENAFFRRSLFFVENVKAGDVITAKNVRAIRPAAGLETKFYDEVLGKTVNQNIERGTPVAWEYLK